MRFLWQCVCGLALLAVACAPGEQGGAADAANPLADEEAYRVVARVNEVPILARRVDEIVDAERARMTARGLDPTPEVLEDLRRSALDLLISSELVIQAARRSGLDVPAQRIDEQLAAARSQFESDAAYDAYLGENGLTAEDLAEGALRRALMAAYAEKITGELNVDLDAAARRIYDEQRQEFRESDQVHVAQIIVRYLPGGSADKLAAARAKIEAARDRLAAGEDFADVAAEYSESPFAEQGGDMGWFGRGRTLPELEDQVFTTEVGAISDVFETRHGLNIVTVLDRKPGRERSFEEIRTGLMLVLVREQSDETLRAHVQDLRNAADVVIESWE